MPLINWTPFDDMEKLFDDFKVASHGASFVPAIDVYQKGDSVMVESSITGIDPEKIDISIENDVLTIKGQAEKKSEVDEKNYYRKEIRSGNFFRSVNLPCAVKGDKASAVYEDGILKISVPKAEEAKPKKIKITAKKTTKK